VLPDFLMANTSLPERTKWIKGLLDLYPDSEALQYLKETIMLALKETKRLTEGFGNLPRNEFSRFCYWFAVQEAQDMEALLEMDEDKDEDGKEKGNTAAAADDPEVIYVEAAATNNPEISVVYAKHWSCKDNNDKNGKQNGKQLKEFPDENKTTKYRQELKRTENFNQGNQEEVDDLTSKIQDYEERKKLIEARILPKPLSPEETEVKKLDDAEALEDAYMAKERRTKTKEYPVIPDESKEWWELQWLSDPIPRLTARCQRCGGLSHLDNEKCLHDAASSSTVMGAAYDVTEEEVPWFEEDSVHAEMLKWQIIGETRCKYEFCPDSSKHRTAVCPELHSRCQECHCLEHYATTLIRRDGENKAVCPQYPSIEIDKLTVREIQMGFEMSASRGLLTKYRHSLPACGFYPCNTDQQVGIIRLITYAKLNCMKTEKAVAMLENMYRALRVKAMIPDVVVSDEEKFKK
jgi:hypothetical protein